ncbi:MAG: signal peptide peptidase SppA [Planctomycetota bacterium]
MLRTVFVWALTGMFCGVGAVDAQDPDGAAVAEAEAKVKAPPEPKLVRTVRLSGAYADLAEQGGDVFDVLAGGGKVKPFYELIEQLDALARDEECDTVLFDLTLPLGLNQPQQAELARAIAALRAGGKSCHAYLENAARAHFVVASQCDRVLLADMGTIDFGALALSTMFMRDALDLLGVRMDVLRCGDFKGAAEPYMRSSMSPHLREHYLAMLETMNDDVVRLVAKGRGLAPERVRELQRQRLHPAKDALLAGLVDRLVPWQGAERTLEELLGEELKFKTALRKRKKRSFNLMSVIQDLLRPADEVEVETPTLAVLHLSGAIVDGHKPVPGSIVSGPAVSTIRELTENENVRGVVVRINSPGGSATASEAIALALGDLAAAKPVVCSMGRLAASGGYYVTCFGRPIIAEATTITGSIGVLGMKPDIGPLMRRVGLHEEIVALDERGGLDAMTQGWGDGDRELIQGMLDAVYDRFLNHVSRSRGLPREQVERLAGGRVWSGIQACELGLVDELGGLDAALEMVAKEAEIGADDDYEIVHVPRARNFMDVFAAELMQMRAASTGLEALVPRPLLRQLAGQGSLAVLRDALRGDRPATIWMLMPDGLALR